VSGAGEGAVVTVSKKVGEEERGALEWAGRLTLGQAS